MSKTTETHHSQNDQRQKMLPRDWHGCQVRIAWSAIGDATGRTGRVVEARHPIASRTGRAIDQTAVNAWIKLDDPIEHPRSTLIVTLIPVQINGACDQLEILKARGEK